jgi:hypothetical protein
MFIFFSFIEVRTDLSEFNKKLLYYIAFICLTFQVGFRWETGTDWFTYSLQFNDAILPHQIKEDLFLGYEIGYIYFVYVIRLFTDNYTFFLVTHALIYYFLVFKSIKFLSPYPIISLFIFYSSTMGLMGSNRQLIALAICLYSLKFILEKKRLKFLLCVLVAFFFHASALIFLVYYFLNRDFKKTYVVSLLLLAILIGKSSIPALVFSGIADFLGGATAVKAEFYNESGFSQATLSLTGLIRRLLFFIVFIVNYNLLNKKWPAYRVIFNGYIVGLIIYFMFQESVMILIARGSSYFTIMECFLMASQLLLIKYKKDRSSILIFLLIYACLIFFQSVAYYDYLFIPYKGIFINENIIRYWQ